MQKPWKPDAALGLENVFIGTKNIPFHLILLGISGLVFSNNYFEELNV